MSKRDSLKCIPIEKLSTAVIFTKCAPENLDPAALGDVILPRLNFVKGTDQEKARYYYCLAYGHYRLGVNQAVLEEVLDCAERGLTNNPEPDVKVGLVFLKVIALFQLAREMIQATGERDRTKEECERIKSSIQAFTNESGGFISSASLYDFKDLIDKIRELRDKIWPTFI